MAILAGTPLSSNCEFDTMAVLATARTFAPLRRP